ncbi:MAG: fibronectin type III domain-containing protein [Bacteroidales bacterium]|nr:fibronectin type III domain-containing protein [Bacteroidales bacterium]
MRRLCYLMLWMLMCMAVQAQTLSLHTTTTNHTAHVEWNDIGALYYELTNDTTSTPRHIADTSATLDSLTANTLYVYYIRPSWDTVNGPWQMFHFTTTRNLESCLPWRETFENSPSGYQSVADGWTFLSNGHGWYSTSYPYVKYNDPRGKTATFSFQWAMYGPGYGNWLPTWEAIVTPAIDTATYPFNTLTLSMEIFGASSNNTPLIFVGAISDPDDYSTFVEIDSISPFLYNDNHTIRVPDTMTNYRHLAIVWRQSSSYNDPQDLEIDNVLIMQKNTDTVVSAFAATNRTDNSAHISWTHPTASDFIYKIGPANQDLCDSMLLITHNNYVDLTMLQPDTWYDIWVAPQPSDSVAEWAIFSFKTKCSILDTLPYTEDWEDIPITNVLSSDRNYADRGCWSHFLSGGMGALLTKRQTSAHPSYAHSGERYIQWEHIYNSNRSYLISQEIDTDRYPMRNIEVSFWVKANNAANPTFEIGVMTDANDTTTYQPVQVVSMQEPHTTWQLLTAHLTNYSGNGRHVVIREMEEQHLYGYNDGFWSAIVDDITIQYRPCPIPIPTAHVTYDSVVLSWAATAGSYQYQLTDSSTTYLYGTSTDTSLVLDSLMRGHQYTLSVRAICGSDTTEWSSLAFTTECPPVSLPFYANFGSADGNSLATGIGSPMPPCWKRINRANSYHNRIFLTSDSYSNGTALNVTLGGGPSPSYIVLPRMDDNVRMDRLKATYKYRYIGYPRTHIIWGVMQSPDDPSSFVQVDDFYTDVNAPSGFQERECTFVSYRGTGRYPAIRISCQDWISGAKLYIDSIVLDTFLYCEPATNVHATSISISQAQVAWSSEADSFAVRLTSLDGTYDNTQIVTDTFYTFTGLTQNTQYACYVRSLCGDDTLTISEAFRFYTTLCDSTITHLSADTSTAVYIGNRPFHDGYRNGYSQEIFDAAQLGDLVVINAIEYLAQNSSRTDGTCQIYMGHTTKTQIAHSRDWVPTDSLQLVYSGENTMTTGWNLFPFQNYFVWDGQRNVVIAIRYSRPTHSNSSLITTACEPVASCKYMYCVDASWGFDFDAYIYDGHRSYPYRRNIVRFVSCGDITCHNPEQLRIDSTTCHTATVSWSGTAPEYEVQYVAQGSTDTLSMVLSDTSATFTGLDIYTTYEVRVRQLCDSTSYSSYIGITFTTDSLPCHAPLGLHADSIGYTGATFSWNSDSTSNDQRWIVHLFNTFYDITDTVDATTWTAEGLYNETRYYASVQAQCEPEIFSEWSDTIEFSTPTCPSVSEVTATDISLYRATIQWNSSDSATSWEIEYGVPGFTQGHGNLVSTDTTSYTITGLDAMTEYAVYVRSICSEGIYSTWSHMLTFTTLPCPVATNIEVTDITHNSAHISWSQDSFATAWSIEYGLAGFQLGTGQTAVVDTPYYFITNLEPYHLYYVYISTLCADGVYSDWSTEQHVYTLTQPEGIEIVEIGESPLILQPNPATSQVSVQGIAPQEIVSIKAFNMSGQQVLSVSGSNQFVVDGWPSGSYIVGVLTSDSQYHYLKLIKQ